jgi:hypothetical protein
MNVNKIDQPKKQHTFPCVLENTGSGDTGCEGLIVFFYKISSQQIVGVVLSKGNPTWFPGYYASNWSVDSYPHHWIPVDIQITHGDIK